MVRFLLEAGADQEHKTDEMHTALMEASMDGHVEVAKLLLDSGAQVNMPADSFESPLTLAACGGHVELAMLLLERGANIEEVCLLFFPHKKSDFWAIFHFLDFHNVPNLGSTTVDFTIKKFFLNFEGN